MEPTEKLLAESRLVGMTYDGTVLRPIEKVEALQKQLGELQNDIEQERTLKQAARLEAVTLQRQLDRQQDGIDYTKGKLIGLAERYQAELEEMRAELAKEKRVSATVEDERARNARELQRMRGDMLGLLHDLEICANLKGVKALVLEWRAKYLEVKS